MSKQSIKTTTTTRTKTRVRKKKSSGSGYIQCNICGGTGVVKRRSRKK